MDSSYETVPSWYTAFCDVRDVSLAHYRAAFYPEAVGNRHIIASVCKMTTLKEVAFILHNEFSSHGYKIPLESSTAALDDPHYSFDTTRMLNVLGIIPTDFQKTVIDMAYSLINAGIVVKRD